MNNQELISRLRDAGQALETLARHLDNLDNQDHIEIFENTQGSENDQNEDNKKSDEKPKPNVSPFARLLGGAMSKPAANPFQLLSSLAGTGNTGSLIPGLASLGNLGNLGGLGALPGISTQTLPTTLAELHDNPQLLAMLRGVSNNPQMINMLSNITGQDSQTLLRALQSLQPQPAAQPHIEEAKAETNADVPAETPLIETKTEEVAGAKAEAPQEAEVEAAPQSIAAFAADLAAKNFNDNIGRNQIEQPLPTLAQTQAAAADIRATNPAASAVGPADSYLDSLLAEWHWQPYARVWTL